MTGQSGGATYIDAFLPRPTPSFVDTEIENRQNHSMSIMAFYFLRFHGIALHSGRNGRLCLSVFFLPLVLGMRLLLLCRVTKHVLISLLSINVSKELANGYYKYIIGFALSVIGWLHMISYVLRSL